MIALTADPRHTNLSLFFDRQIVAIQQAAADEGFTFHSSWMPWEVAGKSYSSFKDEELSEQKSEQRESCPGILAFRNDDASASGANAPRALFVLIVGERPTAGLNQDQWDTAIQWVSSNTGKKNPGPLRILGPTFSGSLLSLQKVLPKLGKRLFSRVQMLSGTVTGCPSFTSFQAAVKSFTPPVLPVTFQESDSVMMSRLLDYLKSNGWSASDVAIVSEDETAYSTITENTSAACSFLSGIAKDDPVILSYPRDISAVRAAYLKQAIGDQNNGHAVRLTLNQNTEEGEETADTVRSFAGSMSPLDQEAALYAIVAHLRTHHAKFVLLRSTNPLDSLFLARFFHRAYPMGRVVTVGSDLLFPREAQSSDLRGILALSNYPLLPRSPNDQSDVTQLHRLFPSNNAQGEYVAARYSFGQFDPPAGNPGWLGPITDPELQEDLLIPAWPGINQANPAPQTPTWLAVLGREGYWPLAALTRQSVSQKPKSIMVSYQPPKSLKLAALNYPLVWRLSETLALLLAFYEILGLLTRSRYSSIGLLSIFRSTSSSSHALLLSVNAAFAFAFPLLFAILELGSRIVTEKGSFYLTGDPWFIVLGIGLALLVLSRKDRRFMAPGAFLLTLGLMMGAALSALQIDRCVPSLGTCGADHYALYYRIVHLNAGISPLLPLLILMLAFYLLSWQVLAGNHLLVLGRPTLPLPAQPDPAPPYLIRLGLEKDRTKRACLVSLARYRISAAMEWRILRVASPLYYNWPLASVYAALVICGGCYLTSYRLLYGFETHHYSTVLDCLLLAALIVTATNCLRLFFVWTEVRRLLSALQRLRLRRTFSRLRAVPAASLWSVSGAVSQIQYQFFVQQMDAGRRLLALSTIQLPAVKSVVDAAAAFAEKTARNNNIGPAWDESSDRRHGTIRDLAAAAVAEVINKLDREWRSETDSLDLETDGRVSAKIGESAPPLPLSQHPVIQTAEEFVCFHYIAFIQNILGRMRTIVLSLVTVFVLSCFAISSYPFVPRAQVSIWMIANLVLVSFCVIYIYAKMERDEILSYLTKTPPGHLTLEFWLKSISFLAGPILGILTTQFPQIADTFLGSMDILRKVAGPGS